MRKLALFLFVAVLINKVAVPNAFAVDCTYVAPIESEVADIAMLQASDEQRRGLPRIGSFKAESLLGDARTSFSFVPPGTNAHLDIEGFVDVLDAELRLSVAGFVMQLRQNGLPIRTKSWQWAKRPNDGSVTWEADQRMHVASVSKLITAMAIIKLLDEKSIPHDAKIIDYLPAHWSKGPNIDQITFTNLLRHQSGFLWLETAPLPPASQCEDISYSDYQFMRSRVAKGVTNVGQNFCYANMNYGLQRILIPIINGDIKRDATISDEDWDNKTIDAYERYVSRTVFAPSHVTGATLVRPPESALAYDFPPTLAGWDSGKLMCLAGAAGWNMSMSEVLNVMGTFRRSNTIMSSGAAQKLLDDKFGIDNIITAGTSRLYNKTGFWYHTSGSGDEGLQMEQALAFFLPEGIELAIFANSRVAEPHEKYLLYTVLDIYKKHISFR
jgi:Beta-lactamase